ncbi:hypothetical protein [Candidatus Arsenophonus triatominarum]|uniref:hypothetical protein n=1 Tax=Candidatus Arsenophonus triatominarum TaxID=57911 RepID=UPI0007C591D1|nr:hypothetical protein [Candidatus Arsenophonus triatominarum]
MSFSIQSNSLFAFNRTLSNEYVQRAVNSSSKEDAIHIGIWEKIKDWFCGTNASEALEHIYELTHNDNEFTTESAVNKVIAFYKLKEMVSPAYQDKFQAFITQNEDDTYIFSFSIKDVMDERALVYGSTEKDVYSVEKKELTNNIVMNKDIEISLLFQIKCSDYYTKQLFLLDSIDGLDVCNQKGTENEWIYNFAQSIYKIRAKTKEKFDSINRASIKEDLLEVTSSRNDKLKELDHKVRLLLSESESAINNMSSHIKNIETIIDDYRRL